MNETPLIINGVRHPTVAFFNGAYRDLVSDTKLFRIFINDLKENTSQFLVMVGEGQELEGGG